VETAHDHRHAAAAEFAGDLIGPLGRIGLDRDGDEIGRPVERNLLHPVIMEGDSDVLRRQCRQQGDRQRLHLPGAHVVDAGAPPDRRMYQRQAHQAASFRPIGQSQV
jgi:hypothetical protein